MEKYLTISSGIVNEIILSFLNEYNERMSKVTKKAITKNINPLESK